MIFVLIPARSGSKGLPHKNIKNLADIPLLVYSIIAAKLIDKVDRIIVSTDSEEYAQLALKYGAEVPFLRPKNISGDKSTDLEVFKHAINWFKKNEKSTPNYFLHLRPTTPLRDPEIIDKAISLFLKQEGATSLRSGHLAPESPFKWFLKDENNYFKGMKKDLTPEKVNLPRQSFPPVYVPNGYIDIIKTETIEDHNTLHGDKMIVFETPVCNEVDTVEDFNYLEYQIGKKGIKIIDYLKKIKNKK